MKTIISYLLLVVLCHTPLVAQDRKAQGHQPNQQRVVNVISEYGQFPESLIKAFEEETGIKVVLDFHESNEALEAKMLAGNTGYDVIFPTVWPYSVRQAASGLYHKIDQSQLPHYKNLDPIFLDKMQGADPGNVYSVPYTWGLVVIGYDEDKIKKLVPEDMRNSWDLLYNPEVLKKIKGCGVTLLSDPTDVFLTYYIYRAMQLTPLTALCNIWQYERRHIS